MALPRLGAFIGSLILASGISVPAGAVDQPDTPTTFSGSCQFSVTVHFSPAITSTPTPGTDQAQGDGTCSGTLTTGSGRQHQVGATPAGYWAEDSGTSSCETAEMVGSGRIVIDGTSPIEFVLHESRVGPIAVLVLQGRQSGAAIAEANLPSSESPQAVASACASGGLASAPVDITLRTAPSIR